MQIANAVCKSRIIGVVTEVILEHASDGIGQEPGSNETHLPRARKERARFLVQLELILEVVEHRSTCTRVLPVFLVCCLCFSVSTRVSRQRRSGPCCARFTGPDAGPRRRRKERKALFLGGGRKGSLYLRSKRSGNEAPGAERRRLGVMHNVCMCPLPCVGARGRGAWRFTCDVAPRLHM